MADANNSNTANRPASYTIVFAVDLTEVNDLAFLPVNENLTSAQLAATRDTWIPAGPFLGCQTRKVKHGDSITVYDEEAYYLKAKYVKSASNPNGILTITTETP